MFKFRRMRAMDPLQVAMTGVRMGERYLQIFCSDASLTRGLAAKTGLSGVAALAAPDETHAARARKLAAAEGVLLDIKVQPVVTLAWDAESFDMVVIDDTGGHFGALSERERAASLASALSVLRPGGRLELIERIGGGGLFRGGVERPAAYERAGRPEAALREAGFKPVRTLAEKDGFRFVEALKG